MDTRPLLSARHAWRAAAPTAHERLTLADGRRVVVRPLSARDAPAEQAFVGALSAASRYRRFHIGLRELPATMLRGLTDIDQQRHVALVAVANDDIEPAAIVADARYVRLSDSADAEFALAVADAWQRMGLGRALVERLARHAREHGVQRLVGDVLWDNAPMIAMVRELGGRLVATPGHVGLLQAQFHF
jgi:acetyltransferase